MGGIEKSTVNTRAPLGLLVNGKVPILFDGHVETMPLEKYATRDMIDMPPPKKKAD
jgi:hypothetical protein